MYAYSYTPVKDSDNMHRVTAPRFLLVVYTSKYVPYEYITQQQGGGDLSPPISVTQ